MRRWLLCAACVLGSGACSLPLPDLPPPDAGPLAEGGPPADAVAPADAGPSADRARPDAGGDVDAEPWQWQEVATGVSNSLVAVWGSAPDDVWAAGTSGRLLHHDGKAWATVASDTSEDLRALWGTSATRAWAVGDNGAILELDAGQWRAVTASPTSEHLYALWSADGAVVWAVGAGGAVVRRDGAWSADRQGTADLHGIWGSAAGDVWAVGGGGAILHHAGTAAGWAAISSPVSNTIRGVWGRSAAEVWAVSGPRALRFDGAKWTAVDAQAGADLRCIAGRRGGSGDDDVWAAGELAGQGVVLRLQAGTWVESTRQPGVDMLRGIWVAESGEVWVVGNNGAAYRFAPAR